MYMYSMHNYTYVHTMYFVPTEAMDPGLVECHLGGSICRDIKCRRNLTDYNMYIHTYVHTYICTYICNPYKLVPPYLYCVVSLCQLIDYDPS